MRHAVIPLLLVWAVIATVFAIRRDTPPPTTRDEAREAVAEVARLRRRVAELERRKDAEQGEHGEPETSRAARSRDEAPTQPPPRTYGEEADRLLAEYRRFRDARDAARRRPAMELLVSLGDKDRSVYLAWVDLLREARDEDEADEISHLTSEATSPDPGGEVDRRVRAALRDLMLRGADGFHRATAAEMLFWIVDPRPEDFRAALDAVRTEGDEDARIRILGDMGDLALRDSADAADAAAYRQLLREAIGGEHCYLGSTLAEWSDDPADFDLLRNLLEKTGDLNLLHAFRGGLRLTTGREAQCVAILSAIVADPGHSRQVRTGALTQLDSLRHWWSTATVETERRYREELSRRR